MNAKRSGILFCAIVLVCAAIELLLYFWANSGNRITVVGSLVISELIMIVPCLIAFLACRKPFGETFGVHKVRPAVLLLCIVFTWMLLPLITCCNAFTLYFTQNETTEIFSSMSDLPVPVIAAFAAVIAPACEEWTFRGILYTGFRKNGSALQAILMTAVLFGLFHMNLNQMVYAMVLGIFFAILREVTGSILPSIVCHMTVNGGSTLLMLLESEQLTDMVEGIEESSGALTADMISKILSVMIPVAAFAAALALGLLIKIAKTQKALPQLRNIVEGRQREKGKIVGVPVCLGMLVCVVFVILELISQA